MYNIFIDGKKVSDYVSNVQMSDNIDAISTELTFSIAKNPKDKYLNSPKVEPGQKVAFYNDKKQLFLGIILEVSLNGDIKANDYGFYMNKQEIIFQASKASASGAIKALCAKCGIEIGSICNIPTKISKVWVGTTPCDILKDILKTATAEQGKNYLFRIEGKSLIVSEYPKKATFLKYKQKSGMEFDPTWSIGEVSGSKSISELRNKVVAVKGSDEKYKILTTVEDKSSESKYGVLATTVSVDEKTKQSPKAIATNKLKELNVVSEDYHVDNMLGSDDIKAGVILLFSSKKYGISGLFLVKAIKHSYGQDESKHIMSLDIKRVIKV